MVARGTVLGRSGMTGHASTPHLHLHFGVCRRPEGRCGHGIGEGWVDPEPLFAPPDSICPEARRPVPDGQLTYQLPCP